MLQQVIRAKHDARYPRQRRRGDAPGKVPGNECRTGQRTVTHGAQGLAARTGHRPVGGTYAGGDITGAHAFQTDVLILDHQFQQQPVPGAKLAHGSRPPGRQTIGIEGDAQALGHLALAQRRHLRLQVALEQTHLLHMIEQAPADLGGCRRRGTHQHRLANPRLEQLDPLRHRRLRQTQNLGRPLETGLLHHRRQGGQQFVIEQISSPNEQSARLIFLIQPSHPD
ncbi:hypothetical protein D9M68_759400 [compost metagenome]